MDPGALGGAGVLAWLAQPLGSVQQLPLFVLAGLLLNLTPGPDVLYTVQHAVRHGARAGMVAALGIGAGCGVHVLAAALGLGALLAASATAFGVLKLLGAAYLVVLGVKALRQAGGKGPGGTLGHANAPDSIANQQDMERATGSIDLWSVARQGFWTNVLNPKVVLFFLAFLPQFIVPGAAHPTLAFVLLGVVFSVNGVLVTLGWALGAAWLTPRLGRLPLLRGAGPWLQRASGVLFVVFGLRLALADNPGHG